MVLQYYFVDIGRDRSFQLLAAQNLLQHGSLDIGAADPRFPGTILYTPLTGWPPGYSLLVAPFLWLFGNNYEAALRLLDLFTAAAFVWVCKKLIELLSAHRGWNNVYLLVCGFFLYPFIGTTDFVGLVFFLAAVYQCLQCLRTPSVARAIAVALFLGGAALIRYLYLPIVPLLPAYLLWVAWQHRSPRLRQAALISGGVLLLMLCIQCGWQYARSGAVAHVVEFQKGFFPRNVRHLYPVLFESFLEPAFFALTVERFTPANYGGVLRAMRQVHLGVALIVFCAVIWKLQGWLKNNTTAQQHHRNISVLVTLLMTAVVTAITVRYQQPKYARTYLAEARYFAPVIVFLQQGLFVLLGKPISKHFRRLALVPATLLLLFTLHGMYFVAKLIVQPPAGFRLDPQLVEERNVTSAAFTKLQQQGAAVYFASEDKELANVLALQGATVIRKTEILQQPDSLHLPQPAAILFAVPQKRLARFEALLQSPRTKLVGQVHSLSLYIITIDGHSSP